MYQYTAEEWFDSGEGTVTLLGSTKFFFECMEISRQLTFKKWIVLSCGSWGHSYHKYQMNPNTDYSGVKTLHYYKILDSNAVVVVSDSSKYIGNSTKAEIEFSKYINLPVFYYDGSQLTGQTTSYPPKRNFSAIIAEFAELNKGLGF